MEFCVKDIITRQISKDIHSTVSIYNTLNLKTCNIDFTVEIVKSNIDFAIKRITIKKFGLYVLRNGAVVIF